MPICAVVPFQSWNVFAPMLETDWYCVTATVTLLMVALEVTPVKLPNPDTSRYGEVKTLTAGAGMAAVAVTTAGCG